MGKAMLAQERADLALCYLARLQGNHVGTDAQLVQVVGPALHHFPVGRQVRRAVVGRDTA